MWIISEKSPFIGAEITGNFFGAGNVGIHFKTYVEGISISRNYFEAARVVIDLGRVAGNDINIAGNSINVSTPYCQPTPTTAVRSDWPSSTSPSGSYGQHDASVFGFRGLFPRRRLCRGAQPAQPTARLRLTRAAATWRHSENATKRRHITKRRHMERSRRNR